MPSPFPGMDPHIESQIWTDFHTSMVIALRDALMPAVRPRYVVRVEERVYVEQLSDAWAGHIRPDLTVLEPSERPSPTGGGTATALSTIAPVPVALPVSEQIREVYLTVRDRESLDVVSVIELVSPTNKRAGGTGQRQYLRKRRAILRSPVHLVELDLLRGGERLPMSEPLPPGDYYIILSRGLQPVATVYAWSLRHPLPPIPVPLAGEDPDTLVDLQAAFSTLYDRAGYGYSLDYRRPVEPLLGDADGAWVREVLAAATAPAV